jgi:hypothetical protein
MVANAGICRIKPMVDMTPEEWEQELAINLTGMFDFKNRLKIAKKVRYLSSISISCKADDQARYAPIFPTLLFRLSSIARPVMYLRIKKENLSHSNQLHRYRWKDHWCCINGSSSRSTDDGGIFIFEMGGQRPYGML